jgi:hypothetical protein
MVRSDFSDDFDPRISLNHIIRDNWKESDVFRRKSWNFARKIARPYAASPNYSR